MTKNPLQKHDLYGILEISPSATPDEIRQAFRIKGVEYYPDLHLQGIQNYVAVRYAYEVLSHTQARKLYDEHRKEESSRFFLPLREEFMKRGKASPHGLYEITLSFLMAKGEIQVAYMIARSEKDYATIGILVKLLARDLSSKGRMLDVSDIKIRSAAQSADIFPSLHDLVMKHLSI